MKRKIDAYNLGMRILTIVLIVSMMFTTCLNNVFAIDAKAAESTGNIVEDGIGGKLNEEISYHGSWYVWSESGRHGGSKGETSKTGDYLEYTFQGVGIDIYSHINPTFGNVMIHMDGKEVGIFSLRNGSVNETALLTSVAGLLPGTHTIKITNLGGGTVNIDYLEVQKDRFDVEDSANGALNPDILYRGNWYVWAEEGRHGGTKAETTDTAATLEYAFNGTGIDVYAHTNPTFGGFHIFIDDVDKGDFSLSKDAGSGLQTNRIASFQNLKDGSHKIRFEQIRGKVNFDYFSIQQELRKDYVIFQIGDQTVSGELSTTHFEAGAHPVNVSYIPSDPASDDRLTITQKEEGKADKVLLSLTLGDNNNFTGEAMATVDEYHNGLHFEVAYNDQVVGDYYEQVYRMPKDATSAMYEANDHVGFIGDSITHDNYNGVSFSSFIYNYYVTRFPNQRIDMYNLGVCSYDAQAVLDVYNRDIANKDITDAVMMLGMNDVNRGLYQKNNYESTADQRAQIRKTYNTNMNTIVNQLKEKMDPSQITLMTPSIYDQTNASNVNSDGTFKTYVNNGLTEFAEDVKSISSSQKTGLVDMHYPMLSVNRLYQLKNTGKTMMQGDLIHPTPMGHSIMGYLFLQQQGVPAEVSTITMNGTDINAQNASVNHAQRSDQVIRFQYQSEQLPMAATDAYKEADQYVGITDDLNKEIIQVSDLKKDSVYSLIIDGQILGEYTGLQYQNGVNIATNKYNPNQVVAMQVEALNQSRKDVETEVQNVKWFEYLQRIHYQNRAYITDLTDYNPDTFTYTLKENAKEILEKSYATNKEARSYYDIKSNPEQYDQKLIELRDEMYEVTKNALTKSHTLIIAEKGLNTALTLPNFFAENMVLQRDKVHTIWGKGLPMQAYHVSLGDGVDETSADITSDANGSWSVDLSALPTKATPYTLQVSDGIDTKIINNIFVGDVFVCAGQSNMELRYDQITGMNLDKNPAGVYDRSETPARSTNKNIKFFTASWQASSTETFDVPMQYGGWTALSNDNNTQLSYTAMYFADTLSEKNPDVPVGIMSVAWGGTPITRWMKSGDSQIYNSHIAPLTKYNIAGILWYQGEDDAKDTYGNDMNSHLTYRTRMSQMIDEYRDAWQEEDLPFIYAQLSRYSGGSNNGVKDFQAIREAQLEAQAQTKNPKNVNMVVTIDTDKGTAANIHPLGKDIIGKRMANVYDQMVNDTDKVVEGPVFEKAYVSSEKKDEMIVVFKEGSADGLQIMEPIYQKSATADHYATPSSSKNVSEFEIAGADSVYYPAEATIQGKTVVVRSDQVKEPVYVRYAYDYSPEHPNLYNAAGLPASPFTSEKTYKVVTIGDSITEGYGVYDNTRNRYSAVLDRKLNADLGVGDFYVVNRGRSGTTLNQKGDYPYWTHGPYKDALRDRGDIYTIALGTNDSKPQNFRHIDNFKADYLEMIQQIRTYNANAKIYICKPVPSLLYGEYPVKPGEAPTGINNPNIIEIGKLVEELAKEHDLTVIDLYDSFETEMAKDATDEINKIYGSSKNADYPVAGVDTMTKYLYDKNGKSSKEGTLDIDRIHPGAYGQQLIADTIFTTLYEDLQTTQVDKSELKAILDQAQAYLEHEADYTAQSWATFHEALVAATGVYEDQNANQENVTNAKEQLQIAIQQLVLHSSGMKDILRKAIDKAEGYVASAQFETLASPVKNMIMLRLGEAKTVYGDVNATNEACATAWLNLANALHYMDFVADKTDLSALIDVCNDMDLSGYTIGVEAFKTALAEAIRVNNDEFVLQDSIQTAYDQLLHAKEGLGKGQVDKTILQNVIASITDTMDESKYKHDAAWDIFQSSLEAAKNVVNDENATKEDVQKALMDLTNAYADIRLLPDEALLAELTSFIDVIDGADLSLYSAEHVNQIMNARRIAVSYVEDPDTLSREAFDAFKPDMQAIIEILENQKLETPSKDDSLNDVEDVQKDDVLDKVEQTESPDVLSSNKGTVKPGTTKTGDATNMSMLAFLFLGTGAYLYRRRKQR